MTRNMLCRTLQAAVEAGASRVVLCDTNGATLPAQAAEIVQPGRGRDRQSPSASMPITTPTAPWRSR